MKIRSILPVTLFILSCSISFAQKPDEKILMTVAGRGVEAGEFIRMYNKSLDPAYKTDLNDYLEQFIAFKLKVADAIDHGYDTTVAYREELNGYRNQLAQSYLTDPDIKEKLLRKAYQRSLSEVNASHILVSCPPDASPEDTLKAYKKAFDVRERGRVKRTGNTVTGEIEKDKEGNPVMIPGSLKEVKAIGWFIEEFGVAQISMNLTNITVTPVHIAYDEVFRKAEERGIRATGSELVGLIPLKAMLDAGRYFLKKQKRSTG
ncbi:MAG: hypothetical protein E4H43_05400, partial [Bacteroidia bacterium]